MKFGYKHIIRNSNVLCQIKKKMTKYELDDINLFVFFN